MYCQIKIKSTDELERFIHLVKQISLLIGCCPDFCVENRYDNGDNRRELETDREC